MLGGMLRRGAVAPVTRALTRVLPPELAITVTDLNHAMLDWAKSHSGLGRVRWQEADALTLALPFGDRLFDCIICQFGGTGKLPFARSCVRRKPLPV